MNMRYTILHNLLLILILATAPGLLPSGGKLAAQSIRIVPKKLYVRNDSLHVLLNMNLSEVRAGNGSAFIFTPELAGPTGQRLVLPPVIVSGSRRARQDRREYALSPRIDEPRPYRILREGRKTGTQDKIVNYSISAPYVSWMRNASLLLRQEGKECCGRDLLALDTLKHNLLISSVPSVLPDIPLPTTPFAGRTTGVLPAPRKRVTGTGIPPASASVAEVQSAIPAVPALNRPAASIDWSASQVDYYAAMVSFLTPDGTTVGKHRMESAVLYLDYPVGKDDIYPDYKNNRTEIDKIDRILSPLMSNRFSTVSRIRVRGYASPDGNYRDNERLAQARSQLFVSYLLDAYNLPRSRVDVSSVAEDWEGLKELLHQAQPPYTEAVLNVIRRYGIFDGREKQLMDLQGGVPYKDMLYRFFPRLRRIEVVVEYDIRKVNGGEASELIYTHPDLLSLEEMYEVACYYRPGSDQYREVYEVAAFHFPTDVVANVNAASAVMLTGDLISAWEYLRKAESDPRAWNNMGVLTLMEGDPAGAISWFRKAVGVEPRKARANLQLAERLLGR